ncbi:hypothetical protein [Flavobacterium lacisediminis]|uniref:Lipoprotein n=1 Tax=Flavobacterium lacisediminis TaxID=2989705 RepID=A0ABT3EHR3_9FLAO|nr:hypothetical protein [Flavobacterium lacisediminis]MCW1147650.1 hypothetical protein [Flavobacterium lacisediminis]
MRKLVFLFLIFVACKNQTSNDNHSQKETSDLKKETKDSVEYDFQKAEVMLEKDILFNGKLTRFFDIKEFEKIFGKADSLVLMSKEEPCSYIFENSDGSKDENDKYIYKKGSRFENSKNQVAVDEFRFTDGNFIMYKGTKLSADTTIEDLKKLFPYAIQNMNKIDVYNEGELDYINLREDAENISDGHINIFFKNGKLYFMHWWFPC